MLCDRLIGNVRNDASGHLVDWIDLEWRECAMRVLRKRSRAGRQVNILMPPGTVLVHGDLLWEDPLVRLAIHVAHCEVLVIRPATFEHTAKIALELGNLHAPAEVTLNEILTLPDGPVEEALDRLSISYRLETRRFSPRPADGPPVRVSTNFELQRSAPPSCG